MTRLPRAVRASGTQLRGLAPMDFRPGKSAHDALEELWKRSMETWRERPVQWVLDVDIKPYFDTLDHTHLWQMLDKRIHPKAG